MIQNNIQNDKEYSYDKAKEDLENYIAEIDKPITDAFLHIIKNNLDKELKNILEIAKQKDYKLKDEFIEEILINFEEKQALEILNIILPNNQREGKDIQTKILNKWAKEYIKIDYESKIEYNHGYDQENNRRSNKEEAKEEVKNEESKEEIEQRNSKSRSDKYIENKDFKKSSEDK